MSDSEFPLGQEITITFKTYNSQTKIDANLADPTSLTVDILDPLGETSTVTWPIGDVVRASQGVFTYTFTPPVSGEYGIHPDATGTVTTSGDAVFTVAPKYGAGEGLDDDTPTGADGLIPVRFYRRITADNSSGVSAIAEALDDAYAMVCDECRRPSFAYGEHTETLDVYSNGTIYPSVTPVATVSDPTGTSLRFGGVYLGGSWPLDNLLTGLPAQRTVTYTGGYHPLRSGTDPELPIKLARAICRIAYLALHPASIVGDGVPAGAKTASVGDVSVSGDLSGFIAIDPSIAKDLARYTRRRPAQPFARA